MRTPILAVLGICWAAGAAAGDIVAEVRGETARFADVEVAKSEGYVASPCVSGRNGGAMGIHYVHAGLIADATLDLARPEAVMYERQPDGSLELVGVEYITHEGPAALGGHLLHYSPAPNRYGLEGFYALHVWAWRTNPRGPLVDMNPAVSCTFERSWRRAGR